MEILLAILASCALIGVAVLGLRGARGLQRRLFLALWGSALVPAALVAGLALSEGRELLALLESPGLRAGADGGLSMARRYLDAEEERLALAATAWDSLPVASREGFGWARIDASGNVMAEGGGRSLPVWLSEFDLAAEPGLQRIVADSVLVLAYVGEPEPDSSRLLLATPADPAVAEELEAVQRGWQGLSQIALYYRELLRGRLGALLWVTVVLIGLAALGTSRWLARRWTLPLAELVEATERVAKGDREVRVRARAVDEIGSLVEAFHSMTDALATSEQKLRKSERMAAWQQIARRLAHEIKNPLTPIQLAVHRLRGRVQDAAALEALAAIEEETHNLRRLADEFSSLGRLPEPRRIALDPSPVIEEVCNLYVPDRVEVQVEIAAIELDADPGQWRQVVSNLVKNAVEALGGRGALRLGLEREGPDRALFTVEDNGPGLPADADAVFEPEFTTRSTGTGLGLAIVRRIVEDHGGEVSAGPSSLGGACFSVRWPLHSRSGSRP